MKTAISLPDERFERVERQAKRLRISRSELFARAVQQYLDDHRAREIRESYDRAFGPAANDDADATTFRREAARRALADVEW